MKEYAQARCVLNIPKLVKIKKKAPKLPGESEQTLTMTTDPDQDSLESCRSHENQIEVDFMGDSVEKDEHQEWSLPLRLMIK